MNDEYDVLETWEDERGAKFELRDYPSHPNFESQRALVMVVRDHPKKDEEEEFFVTVAFDGSFEVTDEVIKMTKPHMMQAYDITFFHEERMEEVRARRERQLMEQYRQGVDSSE